MVHSADPPCYGLGAALLARSMAQTSAVLFVERLLAACGQEVRIRNAAMRRVVPGRAGREFWSAHVPKGASSLPLSSALSRLCYQAAACRLLAAFWAAPEEAPFMLPW